MLHSWGGKREVRYVSLRSIGFRRIGSNLSNAWIDGCGHRGRIVACRGILLPLDFNSRNWRLQTSADECSVPWWLNRAIFMASFQCEGQRFAISEPADLACQAGRLFASMMIGPAQVGTRSWKPAL